MFRDFAGKLNFSFSELCCIRFASSILTRRYRLATRPG
jgi:hypothetical protein